MSKRIILNKLLTIFNHKEKIIRIDDYPSGIRPIVENQTPLFNILDEFEKRQIYFHLAIVPKEMDDFFDDRILGYKYLIPVMHGYDHKYYQYSEKLVLNKDIYNTHTVIDQFDEFDNHSIPEIIDKLKEGKDILKKYFKKEIDTYVPPCNLLNKNTKTALINQGFKTVFSENYFYNSKLRCISSDYYGTLENMPLKKYNCITLHLTWEYDTFRTKGIEEITKKLDFIKNTWNR
jgi:peptidoglycan/xylan/chitin deacetylase (PgdA/CDA1 family)